MHPKENLAHRNKIVKVMLGQEIGKAPQVREKKIKKG